MVGNKAVVRKSRSGGYHLCAAHNKAAVGFLIDMHIDVPDFIRRFVTIDRRMDDRVVEEIGPLLCLVVPPLSVLVKRLIEIIIRSQCCEKRGLVVRRSTHPAVGGPSPFRDRISTSKLLLYISGCPVESMRKSSIFGRHRQDVLLGRIMERIIQSCDHPAGVAEGWMFGHILHLLAVNPHFTTVIQTFEIFPPGERYRCFLRFYGFFCNGFHLFTGFAVRGAPLSSSRIDIRRAKIISSAFIVTLNCEPTWFAAPTRAVLTVHPK